jgi:serine/threonine protein kinase
VAKTPAGVVIGTPYYLSPEQALGGTADERSDLHAAASLVALFEMRNSASIPKLPEHPARHQRFLERLVSKKPDERYRSAAEALETLMGIFDVRGEVPRDRKKGDSPRTIPAFARNNLQLMD